MKKIFFLIFATLSFAAFSQEKIKILPINIERYNLYEHITTGLFVDSTDKFQSGCLFIKVEKTGKVSDIKVNGIFDEKFVSVLKSNILNPKAPWLKINKKKYIWYVIQMQFGQIQSNYSPKEIQLHVLTQDYNLNALGELLIREPGHVIILHSLIRLTNKGMQEVLM
jgi:hypothetical protein